MTPFATLAFLLLIAGCSIKPASQDAQPAGVAGAAAPVAVPAAPPAAPTTAVAKPSGAAPKATKPSVPPPVVAAQTTDKSVPPVVAAENAGKSVPQPAKAPVATAKAPVSPPTKSRAASAAAKPSPTLDLTSLTQRLKDTDAIGVLTKIALKNQVDDLLDQFRAFYQGKLKTTLAELRRPYDLLVLKVLSLLQDSDPSLASAIVASREAIWGILADPKKFATI